SSVRAVLRKKKDPDTNTAGFRPPGLPPAADLPAEVEVVEGDLSRPESIASALTGVTGLFIHPRAVGNAIGELLKVARERGVKRVVTLSAMNVDDDLAK